MGLGEQGCICGCGVGFAGLSFGFFLDGSLFVKKASISSSNVCFSLRCGNTIILKQSN
jgi:hypothetical protein